MTKTIDMDENVVVKTQLEENLGVVIFRNRFVVKSSYTEQFLKVMDNTS